MEKRSRIGKLEKQFDELERRLKLIERTVSRRLEVLQECDRAHRHNMDNCLGPMRGLLQQYIGKLLALSYNFDSDLEEDYEDLKKLLSNTNIPKDNGEPKRSADGGEASQPQGNRAG